MEDKPSVVPDHSMSLTANMGGEAHEFILNAKYDRIDWFPRYGAWILKVVTDQGFVQMVIDEATAGYVADSSGLPVVERDPMFQSELDFYRAAVEANLESLFTEEDEQ